MPMTPAGLPRWRRESRVSADHVGDARQIERLANRAGGHPLYLLELLSAGLDAEHDEALPESIESLVTTRIDKLPAQDRVLLREASVAGLVIDTTLIAESFDQPDLVAPDRWHCARRLPRAPRWRPVPVPSRPVPGGGLRGPGLPPSPPRAPFSRAHARASARGGSRPRGATAVDPLRSRTRRRPGVDVFGARWRHVPSGVCERRGGDAVPAPRSITPDPPRRPSRRRSPVSPRHSPTCTC